MSNSKLLGQPRLNDDLQEFAVDLADPFGERPDGGRQETLTRLRAVFAHRFGAAGP